MPTYEYQCSDCKKDFLFFQKMTDSPLEKCPDCPGKLTRLIGTGAGVIYKGGGFYTTEYRSESYKKRAREEATAAQGGPKTDAPKTDGGTAK